MYSSKSACFVFLLLCFFLLSAYSPVSHGGQISGQPVSEKIKTVEGKRHRLTGRVVKVDVTGGVVHVKGRKGELSFRAAPETVMGISTGERVRVYYVTTPDKKNVVRRIKKLNNGK